MPLFPRRLYVLIFILPAVFCCSRAQITKLAVQQESGILYTLRFGASPSSHLEIESHFKGGPEGFSVIGLCVNKWSGVDHCDQSIRDLMVRGEDGKPISTEHPEANIWVFNNAPGEAVTVSYELVFAEAKEARSAYAARRSNDALVFFGNTGLIVPEHLVGKPDLLVRYRWEGQIPEGWQAASSFALGEKEKEVRSSLTDFLQSIFVLGKYTYKQSSSKDLPTARAVWLFSAPSPATLAQTLHQLASVESSIDHCFEQNSAGYTWFFLPTGGSQVSAITLASAFVLFTEPDKESPETPEQLAARAITLAHELIHSTRAGRLALIKGPVHGMLLAEGAAEFFARRCLLKSGLINSKDWASMFSRSLRTYDTLAVPALNHSAASPGIPEKALDVTGDMLMVLMDTEIRHNSRGRKNIADLLRGLTAARKQKEGFFEVPWVEFTDALRALTSPEFVSQVSAIVSGGHRIEFPENTFDNCAEIHSNPAWTFDAGFDVEESLSRHKIMNVRHGSEAWKAGLRDDQKLNSWSITLGRSDVPAQIQVETDEKRRSIVYFPRGKLLPEQVREIELKKERASCANVF
jgi:predicted metalloprotease with PDZ domain